MGRNRSKMIEKPRKTSPACLWITGSGRKRQWPPDVSRDHKGGRTIP